VPDIDRQRSHQARGCRGMHRSSRGARRVAQPGIPPSQPRRLWASSRARKPFCMVALHALQMVHLGRERSDRNAYFVPSPSEVESLLVPRDGAWTCASWYRPATITLVSFLTRRYYRRLLTGNGVRIWEWKRNDDACKDERRGWLLGPRGLHGLNRPRVSTTSSTSYRRMPRLERQVRPRSTSEESRLKPSV
jgi:hypothetical protein